MSKNCGTTTKNITDAQWRIPEGEEREKGAEEIFEPGMTESSP